MVVKDKVDNSDNEINVVSTFNDEPVNPSWMAQTNDDSTSAHPNLPKPCCSMPPTIRTANILRTLLIYTAWV